MKKKISKLLSMALAFVLAFGMTMTGFAASSSEDEEFTITVTHAAEGETYSAYKIFDVTYSDEDGDGNVTYSYTIDSDNPWFETVNKAENVFTLTEIQGNGSDTKQTYAVTVKEDEEGVVADDADIIAVFTDAVTAEYRKVTNEEVEKVKKVLCIDGIELTPDAEAIAEKTDPYDDSEVTAVLKLTDPGYYYVTTTLGSLAIIDTTNPTVEVGEKNSFPTVSKWVHENTAEEDTWQHEDDASNNEDILFEIEIDNINGAENLVLHDSMDEGLEIIKTYAENDSKHDPIPTFYETVILYRTDPKGDDYDEDKDKITLEKGQDYEVKVVDNDCAVDGCFSDDENMSCAFELDFTGYDFSDVDDSGYIELTYKLHLNTEGNDYNDSQYGADVDEIENGAQVTFGIASFSLIAYAETYSFGFEVYKYTGDMVYNDSTGRYDDPSSTRPVNGVEFELRDNNGDSAKTAYFLEETIEGKTMYLFEGWGTPGEDREYTQTIISGSDGMIYIEGLDTGTYYLYETKARDGYNALSGPVTVTITATYDEDSGALLTHGTAYSYGNDQGSEGAGVVNIQNNAGSILPGTGGMGTTIFYIVGIVLILGAAVILVTRKRLEKK